MISRNLVLAFAASLSLASCADLSAGHTWDPATAAADADRDIAAGNIKFCYVGGRVPIPPGVPDHAHIGGYPRIAVGPQGCIQDERSPIRWEYARRYNVRMWQHVSRLRRQSSNQSLEPTAGRLVVHI